MFVSLEPAMREHATHVRFASVDQLLVLDLDHHARE
ncbi:hypothetical protein OKW35_007810 [Paraburkholderia sp. MM5477-R1]